MKPLQYDIITWIFYRSICDFLFFAYNQLKSIIYSYGNYNNTNQPQYNSKKPKKNSSSPSFKEQKAKMKIDSICCYNSRFDIEIDKDINVYKDCWKTSKKKH